MFYLPISNDPPTSFSQIPLGNKIKASFWLSLVEDPAQSEVAVEQSFIPFLTTP